MRRWEIDAACGQTPCLCGDIESWHMECYRPLVGCSDEEINAAYARAYAIARRKLRERAHEELERALENAEKYPAETRRR